MNNQIKKLIGDEIPKSLREIPCPPEELFYVGQIPSEDLVFLSVVGSRKFTSYGKEVCEKIISGLRGYPIVIVSGLALGIDSVAHRTALESNLLTISFPGSGLREKVLYPQTNVMLSRKIVEAGGCLISEFEPDFRATDWSFPQRNRLMAGISKGVLVIEAEEKSGSLITARLATEYNRDVYAVPGSIFSSNSMGTNKLIHQGATPITGSKDLLRALGFEVDEPKKLEDDYSDCSPEEQLILEALSEPKTKDELMESIDLPISTLNIFLSSLELKGLTKESLGRIYRN